MNTQPPRSRQAQALIDSFTQFSLPFDPELVVEVLRERDDHALADTFEALADQARAHRGLLARINAPVTMPSRIESVTKRIPPRKAA